MRVLPGCLLALLIATSSAFAQQTARTKTVHDFGNNTSMTKTTWTRRDGARVSKDVRYRADGTRLSTIVNIRQSDGTRRTIQHHSDGYTQVGRDSTTGGVSIYYSASSGPKGHFLPGRRESVVINKAVVETRNGKVTSRTGDRNDLARAYEVLAQPPAREQAILRKAESRMPARVSGYGMLPAMFRLLGL